MFLNVLTRQLMAGYNLALSPELLGKVRPQGWIFLETFFNVTGIIQHSALSFVSLLSITAVNIPPCSHVRQCYHVLQPSLNMAPAPVSSGRHPRFRPPLPGSGSAAPFSSEPVSVILAAPRWLAQCVLIASNNQTPDWYKLGHSSDSLGGVRQPGCSDEQGQHCDQHYSAFVHLR